MLGRLRIERVDLPACGRTELVPEMREHRRDLVLDVARGGPDGTTRCALSMNDGNGLPYVAEGDGDWLPAAEPIATGTVIGAAFDWDPARGSFVGIAARGDDLDDLTAVTSFDRIESADCVDWTIAPAALPEPDPRLALVGRGFAYAIQPDGSHLLSFLAVRTPAAAIVSFRSESGDPDSFVMVESPRDTGPTVPRLFAERASFAIEPVGTEDLVLLATSDRGLIALTSVGTSGRFEELPEPLLAPSDVPGTFDRGQLFGPPRLLLSPDPLASRVFYGGASHGTCIGCVASGSALFTIGGGG
jgi:hypothetical protein